MQKVKRMEEEKQMHELEREEMENIKKALEKKKKLCEILGEQAKHQNKVKNEEIETLKKKLEEAGEGGFQKSSI